MSLGVAGEVVAAAVIRMGAAGLEFTEDIIEMVGVMSLRLGASCFGE